MPLLAPLSTGLVLENRYEVAQFLGYGGFGRTYLARDRHRFNELCVLKEFAPQISEPSILRKAEELFQREAGTLYQLRHPQIPEFRALLSIRYQGQDALLLVEQYIAGQSYETWVDRGNRFTEAEAIQFLLDMLPILSYIHDRGVVHRDIAPDNLIREQTSGKPFLIDFGSVRQVATTALQLSGSPGMGTQIHKPGFSPPEQLRGEVFPSTDLYSLAVTTLVLLTGRSPMELYNDHQAQWHWRSFVQVSPALGNLLDRLLSHSPRDRYSSAREVQTLLQSLPGRSASANSIQPNPSAPPRASYIPTPPIPTPLPSQPPTPPTPASHPLSRMNTVAISPATPYAATPPPPPNALTARSPETASGTIVAAPGAGRPVRTQSSSSDHTWLWSLLALPFRLLKGCFQILGFGFKTVDWVMTWMWRALLIVVLLAGGAIASFLWKLDLTPNWQFPEVKLPELKLPEVKLPEVKLPEVKLPDIQLPNPAAEKPKTCSDSVFTRYAQVGLTKQDFYRQVNQEFYDRYPERVGRPLTSDASDAKLRQEWCQIAETVLDRAARDR
ncbi:MAG: hypothetical protein B0A82_18035 [Alkalinema sp. CACIAM 70d]|nr:MAG: hypothetical protein B0A82_18035 [Alkalinema sp. CACIAM 70d]